MDGFWKRLEELGVPVAGSAIRGETNMVKIRAEPDHWSGKSVVVYDDKVTLLDVVRDGAVVFRMEPGMELFDIVVAKLDAINLVPGSEMLVEAGDQPPVRKHVFELDLAKVAVLDKAHDEFIQAMIDGSGKERFDEIAWTKFQAGATFGREPCSRENFVSLRAEYVASRYMCGMDFGDYYNWYCNSTKMLGTDGTLNEEATKLADYLLVSWSDLDTEKTRYWLCRNMDVHPRHHSEFHAYIDEFRLRAGQDHVSAPGMG